MEQINETILSCSDMEGLNRVMTEKWETVLLREHDARFTPGQPITITSTWTTPIGVIRQMSRENPELKFTADLTCMTDENPVTHVLEFVNGNEREVYQRPNYSIEFYPPAQYIGQPYYELMDHAVAIFQRVDVSRGDEGILIVDPVPQSIQVVVESDEYQLKVTKQGYNIVVAECLRRKPGTVGKWLDIEKELKDKFSI